MKKLDSPKQKMRKKKFKIQKKPLITRYTAMTYTFLVIILPINLILDSILIKKQFFRVSIFHLLTFLDIFFNPKYPVLHHRMGENPHGFEVSVHSPQLLLT